MERRVTVEFGPSRSKRFAKALAEAQSGPGECRELEPGRYRVSFVLGTDARVYVGLTGRCHDPIVLSRDESQFLTPTGFDAHFEFRSFPQFTCEVRDKRIPLRVGRGVGEEGPNGGGRRVDVDLAAQFAHASLGVYVESTALTARSTAT